MSLYEAPKELRVRPIEEWGTVVQIATEAGSPTKRLAPADIVSLTKVEGCLSLALSGLEMIANEGRGYHRLGPEEAAVMRYPIPSLVQN